MAGGSGNDALKGGGGLDTLAGGSGTNTVFEVGDTGFVLTNTSVIGGSVINDLLNGIQGANLTATSTVGRSLNAAAFTGSATLSGGTGNDSLTGGIGNDSLSGGLGNDSLSGGAGNNTLSGGLGTNTLAGGSGTGNEVAEAQDASFSLTNSKLTGTTTTTVLTDTLSGIKLASLTATGSTGRTLNTTAFTGKVTLAGGTGNDTLTAGAGTDSLDGGGGSNRLIESGALDFTLTNSLLTATGFTYSLGNVQLAQLTITSGNHKVNAAAYTGNMVLQGGAGNDTLIGGSGNDSLNGGAGNNVLLGGAGNDTLAGGGSGRNLAIGGSGTDSIAGGTGDDILVAGTTTFFTEGGTANLTALGAIMAEWTSADNYATRIARLTGSQSGGKNGTTLLNATTAFDDATVDSLTGGLGLDWFLGSFPPDMINDLNTGGTETKTTI